MATAAVAYSRDSLWEVSFETFYDSYFEELVADSLISGWGRVDEVTRILVATTVSSSAISGWALWNQPGYKTVWVIFSGLTAALSLAHTVLSIPARIKTQAENKRRFASLRADLETFRYRMRIDPEFDVPKFTKEFIDYRTRFSQNVQLIGSDAFRTRKLEDKTQSRLNRRIGNDIQPHA